MLKLFPLLHTPNRLLPARYLLHFPTSILIPAHLYQKDERSLPEGCHSSKIWLPAPPYNKCNACDCTPPSSSLIISFSLSLYLSLYLCWSYVTAPRLGRLVAGLQSRRPRFQPRPICMGFMMDKVALRQGCSWVGLFRFPPASVNPPMQHIHLHINNISGQVDETWKSSNKTLVFEYQGSVNRKAFSLWWFILQI
jgi:hypothetical protein